MFASKHKKTTQLMYIEVMSTKSLESKFNSGDK